MAELEEAGWRKMKPKKILRYIILQGINFCFQTKDLSEMDVKAIFRLVDVDKSGNISRTVSDIFFTNY